MRQLVYTVFITNNYALFHLWWKENSLNYQKVSKYYEHDCSKDLKGIGRGMAISFLTRKKRKHASDKSLKRNKTQKNSCYLFQKVIWNEHVNKLENRPIRFYWYKDTLSHFCHLIFPRNSDNHLLLLDWIIKM